MESERYSRQERFEPIGTKGQQLIQDKTVLIIGAGALGAASAEALVRAGIGQLVLIDRDYVEFSNLQRQQLYTEEDAENRIPKAIAAKQHLKRINSDVTIQAHVMDGQVEELEQLIPKANLVLDATDNFDTRLIINDISQKYQVPWIYGGCVGSYGLSYTIIPGLTPCLQCMLESVPLGGASPTCDTVGVISPAVQMVTSLQVSEAMKLLVEDKEALRPTLVSFDVWSNHFTSIDIEKVKKENCSSCGEGAVYPFLQYDNQMRTAVLCGRNTVQIRPAPPAERNLNAIRDTLQQVGTVESNDFLLSFVPKGSQQRMVLFRDGRALIHGTADITAAKSMYYKWIG